jgi:hypothetical protein
MARLTIQALRFQGRGPYDLVIEPGECVCIAAGTGFGVVAAVGMTARRLFDDRHRLRLERLR